MALPPENLPSARRILLPSRAFLLSWRDQNLPARHAALDDSVAHYHDATAGEDVALRDMALLGVIADAMQCLEDFAVLASAWDSPWTGLAHYLRATEWTRFRTTNFWQEAPKWSDERFDSIAGHAFRDAVTGEVVPMFTALSEITGISDEDHVALDAARDATRARLRRLLGVLAGDWKQFSPYFIAFKHGGLVLSRDDLTAVEDEVQRVACDTPRIEVSIAVWRRSLRRDDVAGNAVDEADAIVDVAGGSGRLALDLIDALIDTRIAVFDGIELGDDGEVVALTPLQVPWTVWLRAQDLDEAHWKHLGRGPRINWIDEPDVP